MSYDKNIIAEIHYFYFDTPDKIEYKVLHNFYSLKDTPWPLLFRSGISHTVALNPLKLNQADYVERNDFYLSHNLWTCDCDPYSHLHIHHISSVFCGRCKKTIKNFNLKYRYWYEVFPYEIKDYHFDQKEAEKHIQEYYDFKETNKGIVSKYLS